MPEPLQADMHYYKYKQLLVNVSQVATGYIGTWAGSRIPLYFVVEFPRSGGQWMAKMLSEYMQLDMPKGKVFPITRKSIVHGHYSRTNIPNVVYIVRDGRDAAVSMAFKDMHRFKRGRPWDRDFIRKRHPSMAVDNLTDESIRSVLPRYLEEWFSRPTGTRVNWSDHVMKWQSKTHDHQSLVIIRYEDMLKDSARELKKVIKGLTSKDPDNMKLTEICQRNTFLNLTGRQPGDAVLHADRRKGIAGDWKNYFSYEAGKLFANKANKALLAMNYEANGNWYTSLDH